MTLMGYQFPELADVEYDSNWLNVKIEVSHPRCKWLAVDPALLTYEVQWLIDWFRSVSAGRHEKPHLWFTEPCLSFHLSPTKSDPHKLVVQFSHEFRPPWATEDLDEQHELVFPLQSINLMDAAESLEVELRRYPQRAER